MRTAGRIHGVTPYIFALIDEKVYKLRRAGRRVFDLSKADPSHPTPEPLVEELRASALNPENHHYPAMWGSMPFREAVAGWYRKRFGVDLDPDQEVHALLGSKEGLAHISLAFLNPGDVALVPDPAFPAYRSGVLFAGGKPVPLPLLPENGNLPDLTGVPVEILEKARLLFINYPNNPTGGVASLEFFTEVVRLAHKYGWVVCHDHAYSETTFDGYRSPSILQVSGARDVAVEFFTFSKTFCMTGWRLGAVVGCSDVIHAFSVVHTNINAGVFAPIQLAGVEALDLAAKTGYLEEMRRSYQRRRDFVIDAMNRMGWSLVKPRGGAYVWFSVPPGFTSDDFTEALLEEAGVALTPGPAFGETGDGFARISLTASEEDVRGAMERLGGFLRKNCRDRNNELFHRSNW